MREATKLHMQLIGAAIGVTAALALWPTTRGMLRMQWNTVRPGASSGLAWSMNTLTGIQVGAEAPVDRRLLEQAHRAAAALPNDYLVQLADALTAPVPQEQKETRSVTDSALPDSKSKLRRLRALTDRFGDSPSLYAHLLSIETIGTVTLQRSEQVEMVRQDGSAKQGPLHVIATGDLEAYDHEAAEGERMDPDNAYFPLMRSVGLFSAHRDAEALAAIHRAAQRPAWREYVSDETDGEAKLERAAFGDEDGLAHVSFAAMVLLPQYAQFRATARMAAALAMHAEQRGDLKTGALIREDILRCGARMRAQSTTLIGNRVGGAISMMALQRPEGAALMETAEPAAQDTAMKALLDAFDRYAERAGRRDLASAAHEEVASNRALLDIIKRGMPLSPFSSNPLPLEILRGSSSLLLVTAVWLLLAGAGCALLGRLRPIRTGRGLGRSREAFVCGGVAAGVICSVCSFLFPASAVAIYISSAVALVIAAACMASLSPQRRVVSAGIIVAATAAGSLIAALMLAHARSAVEPLYDATTRLFLMVQQSTSADGTVAQGSLDGPLVYRLTLTALIGLLPATAAAAVAVIAVRRGVPLSVALVRGFRGIALPAASVLVLANALLLPITARRNTDLVGGMQQVLRHEGRYIASLTGLKWPD